MHFDSYGIVGLIILILDLWAIFTIASGGRDIGTKFLWIVLIVLLPLIGLIGWLLFERR